QRRPRLERLRPCLPVRLRHLWPAPRPPVRGGRVRPGAELGAAPYRTQLAPGLERRPPRGARRLAPHRARPAGRRRPRRQLTAPQNNNNAAVPLRGAAWRPRFLSSGARVASAFTGRPRSAGVSMSGPLHRNAYAMPDTRPTREQAEDAVRTLLAWAGEDPAREGLLDTPRRVVDAYADWFSGYALDPDEYMGRTFEEVGGYD